MHPNALPEIRLAALEREVRQWLRLDTDLRKRLELPRGWSAVEIQQHREDLKAREDVKARIWALLANRPSLETDRQQDRVVQVLNNMIRLCQKDETYVEMFSEILDDVLDDINHDDGFGTEGQDDPRGDFRNGEWHMWHVEGVDSD